jgi:hypothetical protein
MMGNGKTIRVFAIIRMAYWVRLLLKGLSMGQYMMEAQKLVAV